MRKDDFLSAPDEDARLAALRSYHILDTPPEPELDNLTRLIATICGVPTALVTLIDEHRQWFKSKLGFEPPETPREVAFCAHAILGQDVMEIRDTLEDDRFARNPLVTGEPHIRFYAGAPLRSAEGHNLGTLCVIDRVPRRLDSRQREALSILAGEVMTRLELRRQIRTLRAAEESLRVLSRVVEASPAGVLVADARQPDLPLVYVNPSFERTTGYSAAEALGRNCRYLQGEDRGQPGRAELRDALHNAAAATVMLRNYRKDGSLFWNELRIAPVSDPTGAVSHFVGIQTDVTERKRLEDALRQSEANLETELARRTAELRESEERFRLIAENSRDLIALFDEDGRFAYASPSFERVLGYRSDDLVGAPREELFAEEDRERLPPLGGQDTPILFRLRRADGTLLWIEGTSYSITTGGRRLIVATGHDVTQRKLAEEELASTQRYLQAIVDSIPGIVYVFDLEQRRAVFTNKGLPEFLGYSPAAIAAMGAAVIERVVHPDDLAAVREAQAGYGSAQDGAAYDHEYRVRHASGGWRFLRTREVVFEREAGAVRSVLGFALDITKQREAEELLRQAQKVEAVGRLAGGIAHDFNNILGVITGYGELAQRQLRADHPARARLDQVIKAAGTAANLTRQLLAFSRKQVVQPKVLDLNAVIADAEKMLSRLIGEDVELVVRPGAALSAVKADQSQLEQVILNLAVNARDAMPRGGRLTIETANADPEDSGAVKMPSGSHVMLAVSDTGVGMDAETQARIFEPFFTTKGEGQGTGLGLATVAGIIEQTGGRITVDSVVSRGTTFRVYLPRVDEEAKTAAPPPAVAAVPRGHETILVVEDTESLREVICEVLEGEGYTVLQAADGDQAGDVARRHTGSINLLVTDVVMPRMGGGDLARALAADRPEMRVLYMSGYTQGAMSHHLTLSPGALLLEKPFTTEKLARAVREALEGSGTETKSRHS